MCPLSASACSVGKGSPSATFPTEHIGTLDECSRQSMISSANKRWRSDFCQAQFTELGLEFSVYFYSQHAMDKLSEFGVQQYLNHIPYQLMEAKFDENRRRPRLTCIIVMSCLH